MFKKICSLLVIVALSCSLFAMASDNAQENQAKPDIKVFYNGNAITFDVKPCIQEGRTIVPMRAILEALGAEVSWDGSTQTITVTKGSKIIKLQINNKIANVNGQDVTLEIPAQIIDGRTMVPLRFIVESMDISIDWDGNTSTITIKSNAEGIGTLTVGMDDTYMPMEFMENGSTVGFDVDLANEIGKRLGKAKVTFVSTAWEGIFSALNSKKFDCIISSVTSTDERKELFSLTKPYVYNKQVIVTVASNTDITSIESLSGKKVCVQSGTTADDWVNDIIDNGKNIELSKSDTIIEVLDAVSACNAQAAVMDGIVGMYYVNKEPSKFKIAFEDSAVEPYSICLRKENSALRDQIDSALDAMYQDGTMKKLSEKWFGKDITTNP